MCLHPGQTELQVRSASNCPKSSLNPQYNLIMPGTAFQMFTITIAVGMSFQPSTSCGHFHIHVTVCSQACVIHTPEAIISLDIV